MPMKRVLVTGAYSLTGSHVLDQVLRFNNVSVRAVVSSREEAHILEQQYPSLIPSLLDFAVVSPRDGAIPGAYDEALDPYPEPFDTVFHTVAADSSEGADCLSRFIDFEAEALINFLRSVNDTRTRVRRVIITTSLSPFARWLVGPELERNPRGGLLSSQMAADVLVTSQSSDNLVYNALSNWMRDSHAPFDVVSLTAPSIYGPSIRPLKNSSDLEEANRRIWNICCNDANENVSSPPYGIDYFADVRDFAFACVQAALKPQAGNRHFVISAGTMPSGSAIADFLVGCFPELGSRVRSDLSPPRRPPSGDPSLEVIDTHLAATILGISHYRRLEDTLTDLTGQILELHRRKDWRRVIQS